MLVTVVISCGNVGDNQPIVHGDNATVFVNYSAIITPDGTTNGFKENIDTGEQTAIKIAELATTNLEYGLEFTNIVYSLVYDRVYLNFLLRNIGITYLYDVYIICRFTYTSPVQYYEYWLREDIAPGLLNVR